MQKLPYNAQYYQHCLSAYATSYKNAVRQHADTQDIYRTAFQRDRDRLIHSNAFRRLKHKTQVFVAPVGDHFRTRLTHSLEVAQIARSFARLFGLDEDLSEVLALGHDIGHPPFGHSGEDALQQSMAQYGGFNHNIQALRIVILLEQRHPSFVGMNLTNITLACMCKHNGALTAEQIQKLPMLYQDIQKHITLDLEQQPPLEGQFSNISDDIAYNAHDLDDGFRAGLLSLKEIQSLSWLGTHIEKIQQQFHIKDDKSLVISELVRRMVSEMINDVMQQTMKNLEQHHIKDYHDVISHKTPLVHFSAHMLEHINLLRQFLKENYYFSPQIKEQSYIAKKILQVLFDSYMLDIDFVSQYQDECERAVGVCDYISGMTDHFAIQEYCHITGTKAHQLPFASRFHR